MTTRNRVAHTASFLQTFHSGQTTAARRADAGAQGSEPKAAPADAEAVAFVTGRPAAKFAQPVASAGTVVEIRGWKVLTGLGLVSEPQAKWMIDIASRPSITDAMRASLRVRLEQGFARDAASQFITKYKNTPTAAAEAINPGPGTTPATVVEADGIYVDPINGRIFKVQFNRGQGSGRHLYAKQLWIELPAGYRSEELLNLDLNGIDRDEVRRDWRYASGLIRQIKPEWKLSPEQAEAYGQLYGSCIRCGRDLTKESSIRQSMGDKCASKSGF
jgi:hypothetical protein